MFTYVVMFKGVKSNALVTNISCTCELNVHCMYTDFRNLRRNVEEICFAYEINQCTLYKARFKGALLWSAWMNVMSSLYIDLY